jgi:hypothetical protein
MSKIILLSVLKFLYLLKNKWLINNWQCGDMKVLKNPHVKLMVLFEASLEVNSQINEKIMESYTELANQVTTIVTEPALKSSITSVHFLKIIQIL